MRRIISIMAVLCVLLFAGALMRSFAGTKKAKVQKTTAKRGAPAKSPTSSTKRRKAPAPTRTNNSLRVAEIEDVEHRLHELGYWTGPPDGKLDATSQSAIVAFQKVVGRPRTGKLTRAERAAIMRTTRPEPLENGVAHIEIDLRRQVLFVVDDEGLVTSILPVSTGSGKDFFAEGFERTAVTPPGRFTIQAKIAGWKKSALGRLYYPNYIIGGIAIHGYPSIPAKPASHGCIRIPMFAAKEFSGLFPVGTSVIVHEGKRAEDADVQAREPT